MIGRVEELQQCGFVRSYTAYGKKKREALFQLIDNFALFHLRFVAGESHKLAKVLENVRG